MATRVLDNPIWESLVSRHRSLAQRHGDVARYPAEIAPFLGVAAPGIDAKAALESLVAPREIVYLLGPTPAVPDGWRLEGQGPLAQMICPAHIGEDDGPDIIDLTQAHRADVLALTARVYPHYFRPRTMDLGRYFGIYRDGRLAAMIGERMGMDDHQEISAVCSDPGYLGRGYARRLLVWLSNDNIARGRTPFLHVSKDNQRAIRLYERNGYRERRGIPFWSLCRAADQAHDMRGGNDTELP